MENVKVNIFAAVILLYVLIVSGAGTTKARGLTDEDKKSFKNWKTEFNKSYSNSKSEDAAIKVFVENILNINSHNKRKNETYKRGTNAYSDHTLADVRKSRTGLKVPSKGSKSNVVADQLIKDIPPLDNVNFTDVFPSVRDQLNCSGSWAFSAIAVIDYWMRRSQRNYSYSEQNLIDCDKTSTGCEGGWPTNALNYIRDEGISDGSKYPFKGVTHACRRTTTKLLPILKIPNACEVKLNGNEDDLKKLISQHGPIAGAMAITDGFINYKSGVFYDQTCSKKVEHAVTIVGYGTSKDTGDYWIIRNSWGKTWGMKGYALVARNRMNHCAVASYAMFPC